MAQITAKIISADTNEKGQATIIVELTDAKGKWEKVYKQSSKIIKAQAFKDMVIADIRRDLKVVEQLEEIKPLVGKTFNFNV